jgi:argininosuccinate lyase
VIFERVIVMDKMWAGRFSKALDKEADDFNSSLHFDCKMFKQDIAGSIAHAHMLAKQGIITDADCEEIVDGLTGILEDILEGRLTFDSDAEDIHMFIESELTARKGDVGKRLHTARSRNDQVAVDIRLYLRDEAHKVNDLLYSLIEVIRDKAAENQDAILPGYTHLQRAQPITFAHHLLAYAQMFIRDAGRLQDAVRRMNYSPLGSCALSGTTYDTDREYEAEQLGFYGIMQNSMDGVSDRDF